MTDPSPPPLHPARPPAVVPVLAAACGAACLVLAVIAATCALVPPASRLVHVAVGLSLDARLRPAPAPSLSAALGLLTANVRATAWPLIPAALRAGRHPWLARCVDVAVTLSLAVNLLPIGAALGVYRLRLPPYLPQLPLELYALTTGAAAWWLSSRRHASGAQLGRVAASMLVALAGAAALETWAVPNR